MSDEGKSQPQGQRKRKGVIGTKTDNKKQLRRARKKKFGGRHSSITDWMRDVVESKYMLP